MPDPTTVTYVVTNDSGNELRTIPNVLAEVRQSGCAVDTTNIMTVTDSSPLFVGMGVCCLNVPEGTYITAINSETEVTLSEEGTGTSGSVMACFKGFNFVTISKSADRGWWRNTVSGTTAWDFKTSNAAHVNPMQINGPFALVPKTFDGFTGGPITYDVHKDDSLAAEPSLRTKTEHWSFWTLVSTGGHISVIPFDPEHSLHLKALG